MLRPEQMSKVSVTGSKSIMDDVIETMHEMHLVHITEYDGSWEGFEPGTPLAGSDETSSKLVTVRAIESILDISEDDVGPTASVDVDEADERLEEIRTQVNELDERRDELRNVLRHVDERMEQMEVYADLGLELELLWGYDSLDVKVGEGSPEAIEGALADAADVDAYEVFSGSETVAVFGYMDDDTRLEDALVGVPFTEYDVPQETGSPQSNVEELEHQRRKIQTQLDQLETELEGLKLDCAGFMLALEEELSIDAQKYEAPLRFATTERSFIVEGWVPTNRYDGFEAELRDAVGDRIEVAEIERAQYTNGGHVHTESHGHGDAEAETDGGQTAATDGGQTAASDSERVATDGGTSNGLITVKDDPPVIQRNPGVLGPFELLVKAVNRPKYSEFDPTIALFLTFPLFFGFMIGDIGYGVLYVAIGYWVIKSFDSQGLRDFGKIVAWLGVFTIIFGVLYGEIFGLHFLEWFGSHPPLEKGISDQDWAVTWLIVAVLVGWVHLNLGYLFNLVEEFQLHGTKAAIVEVGSWLLMLNGLWVFIFSDLFAGSKPEFLVGSEALLNNGPLGFGFTGFPELAGILGLAAFGLGLLLLLSGPWYEAVEFLVPLAHTLSYTRLTAVLLAKAGMAVAVNLLYWGAYLDESGFHFMHSSTPAAKEAAGEDIVFNGLSNMGTELTLGPMSLGAEGAILGIPVLIIGHLVVLAIGGTAAIQAIRLEYFEFFEKFYEGGGKNYQPFGYDRTHTTEA